MADRLTLSFALSIRPHVSTWQLLDGFRSSLIQMPCHWTISQILAGPTVAHNNMKDTKKNLQGGNTSITKYKALT
jgi:hypothetical protein